MIETFMHSKHVADMHLENGLKQNKKPRKLVNRNLEVEYCFRLLKKLEMRMTL
jgi:hypothetical protein